MLRSSIPRFPYRLPLSFSIIYPFGRAGGAVLLFDKCTCLHLSMSICQLFLSSFLFFLPHYLLLFLSTSSPTRLQRSHVLIHFCYSSATHHTRLSSFIFLSLFLSLSLSLSLDEFANSPSRLNVSRSSIVISCISYTSSACEMSHAILIHFAHLLHCGRRVIVRKAEEGRYS